MKTERKLTLNTLQESAGSPFVPAPQQSVPELLAPAGNRDAFFAAFAAGADAVYLGVDDFNARRGAENFTRDDLRELCDISHLADRRIYFTLNTVIRNNEFDEALELARQAWYLGVDAVIVQDLGLIHAIRTAVPDLKIHASTQLNAHNSADLLTFSKLGIQRVTLARELSMEEVATLSSQGIETEVFAHGALCFCYSGQCLMSSMIGRRSANRGLCAQPCRLPWKLIDTSTGRALSTPGSHLLSPGDLCTLPLLEELVKTGISSLKIEGRMKSATYVFAVIKAYRTALDALFKAVDADVAARAAENLPEVFSRPFTTAYLSGDRSNAMMSYQRPNNRGIHLGRVVDLCDNLVGVELARGVEQGDLLEIWTSKGNQTVTLENFYSAPDKAGETLLCAAAHATIYFAAGDVRIGDRVFRVRNKALEDEAHRHLEPALFSGNSGLVPIDFTVEVRLGKPLRITAKGTETEACERHSPASDISGTATGPTVEQARTKSISVEEVREHVSRVGGTPFSVNSCTVELDDAVGLGYSALHATRAQALDALCEALLAPWHERRLISAAPRLAAAAAQRGNIQLAVLVRDAVGARAAAKAGAPLIYAHLRSLEAGSKLVDFSYQESLKVVPRPWLPNIIHDEELPFFENLMMSPQPLVANTFALLTKAHALEVPVEAGPSILAYNKEALALLAKHGVQRVWLSPELSYDDIGQIAPTSPVPLGIMVSGYQELMVSEHCILMAQGDCAQNCAHCVRRKAPRLLEDRKGYRFPVRTDDAGRSHLYNAIPLDLFAEIPRLISLGITSFLVDATLLTTTEITTEVERAMRAVKLAIRGAGAVQKREGYTTGSLFRDLR